MGYSLSLGGETNPWPSLTVNKNKCVSEEQDSGYGKKLINSIFEPSKGIGETGFTFHA